MEGLKSAVAEAKKWLEKSGGPEMKSGRNGREALGETVERKDLEKMSEDELMRRLNEKIHGMGKPLYDTDIFQKELIEEVKKIAWWSRQRTYRNATWHMARAMAERYGYVETELTKDIRKLHIIEKAALAARERILEANPPRGTFVTTLGKEIEFKRLPNGDWEFDIPEDIARYPHVSGRYTGRYRDYGEAKQALNDLIQVDEEIVKEALPPPLAFDASKVEIPPEYLHVEQVLNKYAQNKSRWRRIRDTTILAAVGATVTITVVTSVPVLAALAGTGYVGAIVVGAVGGGVGGAVHAGAETLQAEMIARDKKLNIRLMGRFDYLARRTTLGTLVGAITGGLLEHFGFRAMFQQYATIALDHANDFVSWVSLVTGGESATSSPGPAAPPLAHEEAIRKQTEELFAEANRKVVEQTPQVAQPPAAQMSPPVPEVAPPAPEPLAPATPEAPVPQPAPSVTTPAEPPPPEVSQPPRFTTTAFSFPLNESSAVRNVPEALGAMFQSAGYNTEDPAVKWIVDTINEKTYGTRGSEMLKTMTNLGGLTPRTIPDNVTVDFTKYFKSPLTLAELEAALNQSRYSGIKENARSILESLHAIAMRR